MRTFEVGFSSSGMRKLLQILEQVKVPNSREGVADALGTDGQRFADGLWAGGFAGVVGEPQTSLRGFGVQRAECLGAGAALVASEADSDDGRVRGAEFGGLAEDPRGLFDREVAHGVEDPVEREAQLALATFAGAFQGGEDRLEGCWIVVAPAVEHAHGDVDLGVDDALRREMLDHAPGGQFVVLRSLQQAGDGLEGVQKSGEVGEAIERLGLGERQRPGARTLIAPPCGTSQARPFAY